MWTYNSIQITTIDLKEQNEQTLAKLQPVNTGTVYQSFGYINETLVLQGYVLGTTDRDSLKALANDGTAHALAWTNGTIGNYYLEKLTVQWVTAYRQTFRTDKSATELIFKVSLELSEA